MSDQKKPNMNQKGKPKFNKKTAKRLLKYVTETYKIQFVIVFVCILLSAIATTAVSVNV